MGLLSTARRVLANKAVRGTGEFLNANAGTVGALALTGAGALSEAQAAQAAQESPELARARRELRELEADATIIGNVDSGSSQDAILNMQLALQRHSLYLKDANGRDVTAEGRWGTGTAIGGRDFKALVTAARTRLNNLERDNQTRASSMRRQDQVLQWTIGGAAAGLGLRGATVGFDALGKALRNRAITRQITQPGRSWFSPRTPLGPISHANTPAARTERIRRASNLNDILRRGGGVGDDVPFTMTSTPRGYARRGGAAEPSSWFPAQADHFRLPDMAITGSGLLDAGYSTWQLFGAGERLKAALAAYAAEESEENRLQVEIARDEVALWESYQRFGIGVAGISAGAAGKLKYIRGRPNVSALEQELGLLRALPRARPRKTNPKR